MVCCNLHRSVDGTVEMKAYVRAGDESACTCVHK